MGQLWVKRNKTKQKLINTFFACQMWTKSSFIYRSIIVAVNIKMLYEKYYKREAIGMSVARMRQINIRWFQCKLNKNIAFWTTGKIPFTNREELISKT